MESSNKKPRCRHISKIGSRCQADPQTGKNYCFFHDPDQKKKQAEARKQGGETRTSQMEPARPNLPYVRLDSSGAVFELLALTVNHLRCAMIDVPAARTIAYLASLLLRALKADQPRTAQLLSDIINEVRSGQTDLRTAKTIGNLTAIMLTALKQEAQKNQSAAAMLEARRPAEPKHPAQAPRHDTIESLITQIVTAKPPDDQEPHPVVISSIAVPNTASQSLSS
jgi:hypothetical protein